MKWNFLINTYITRVDFSDDNDDISFTKLLEFHQEYLIETKLEVFENEVTSNEESNYHPIHHGHVLDALIKWMF